MKSIFTPLKTPPSSRERGVALLVTLAVLAMVTVLLVAFVSNVRTERTSSRAFSDQLKARLAAQAAIEQGIFCIQQMTQSTNYVTFVSNSIVTASITNSITYFVTNGFLGSDGMTYDYIHSSYPPSSADNANLNAQGYIYPLNMVPNLSVPWTYYTNSFATSPVEAIRGMTRYAYWIDDESSKINVNAAGYTAARTTFGVTSIDLRGLPTVDSTKATSITNLRSAFPYETVASLAQVGGLDYNALYKTGIVVFATVNSADYERQTNGQVRVNINQFAVADNATTNAQYYVTNIVTAITNACPQFVSKYTLDGLHQIAANLRDYLDTDCIPTDADPTDFSGTKYFGNDLVPRFNEVMFQVEARTTIEGGTNTLIGVTNRYFVELFNPYQQAAPNPVLPNTTTLVISNLPTVNISWVNPVASNTNSSPSAANVSVTFGNAQVPAYSYWVTNVIVQGMLIRIPTNDPGTVSISIPSGGTITNVIQTNVVSNTRIDYSLIAYGAVGAPLFIQMPTSPAVTTNNFHASVHVPGDPRFNHRTNDWDIGIGNTAPAPTLGTENAVTVYDPAHNSPYYDVPVKTKFDTDKGLPFQNGPMLTVGEIGNIGTITNWSTLKIYGDGRSNVVFSPPSLAGTTPPDWALLDLFTINDPGTRIPGKININTQRDLLLANPPTSGSLFALLNGILIDGTPITSAGALATNLIAGIPYSMIGEIGAKASSLSLAAGTGVNQDTDERREAVIRALSNITTVRGNQFTIWGMGQSIQIVRGQTNVTGEAMIQAIVERTELFDNPPTHMTGATYRIKYLRNVTE